jgi:hypothetical protein
MSPAPCPRTRIPTVARSCALMQLMMLWRARGRERSTRERGPAAHLAYSDRTRARAMGTALGRTLDQERSHRPREACRPVQQGLTRHAALCVQSSRSIARL